VRRPLFLIALAVAIAVPGRAEARERLVRHVGRDQGIPVGHTAGLVQDADGFLWIGTSGGILRWDGSRAVRWAPETIGGTVYRLATTSDGAVWAAEYEGPLYRIDPARPGAETTPIVDVLDLVGDRAGGLWVASEAGLYHRDPAGAWRRAGDGSIDGQRVLRLGALNDGTVLAATWDAVYAVGDGPARRFVDVPMVAGIAQGDDGTLWLAAEGATLWEVNLSGPTPTPIARGTWKIRTWDLVVRGDEAWLIGGGLTVSAVPGGIPEEVNDDDRLPAANSGFVDREGSVWFATNRGLVQLVEPATAMWTERDGIQSAATRYLARTDEGMWVSAWTTGWTRIDDVARDGMVGRAVARGAEASLWGPMCVGADGELWTGSGGNFTVRRDGAWSWYPIGAGDDFDNCLTVPGRGVLLGSMAALHVAVGREPPRPLPSPIAAMDTAGGVGPMVLDRDGTLWAAAHDEVCRAPLDAVLGGEQAWRCEPVADALDIYRIVETPSGALWIATAGRGFLRRDGARWIEIESGRSLPSRTAHVVVRARDGETIWLSGPGYLLRVREEGAGTGWAVVEDLGELQGVPLVGGGDVWEDADGTVWTTTGGGVVEIPARARRAPPPLGGIALVEARLDGRAPAGTGRWWLGSDDNHVALTVSALSYRDPGRIRYRVRVDGGAWSQPAEGATIQLVDLPPGEHRVDIEASSDGVRWAGLAAPVLLGVPRPWWQRPWLWSLAILLLIAAIVIVQRARYAVRLRLAQQRVRIAMDLHDEIGSGLGSIGILAGMASSGRVPAERGAELTGKVAHTAQRLGQSLTDIVAALREGGDRLDALFDYLAERGGALMPDDRPRLEMRPPGIWPTETMSLAARRTVQLIALEAMHNAVRHAQAGRVEVGAAVEGRRWRLWIEDDGVGIGGGAAPRPGGGQGQRVMRRRAEAIRAELRIGPGAGGRGTRVEIVFDPDAKERTT
jgi:signal transduction histidine kinase/ligand-binding sensor domain-containing protein